MCEPYHSVQQWSSTEVLDAAVHTLQDDKSFLEAINGQRLIGKRLLLEAGDLDGARGDVVAQFNSETTSLERLQFELREAAKYLSESDGFFHLSRFGMGHHESAISRGIDWLRMPTHTDYEIHWWDRQIKFDGDLRIPRHLVMHERRTELMGMIRDAVKREALKACSKYADRTSIGNPGTLRRFLEETLLTTTNIVSYQDPLRKLFIPKGLSELEKRLKLAELTGNWFDLPSDSRIRLIKVVCGLTRKREFMVPEWSDVPAFWAKTKE